MINLLHIELGHECLATMFQWWLGGFLDFMEGITAFETGLFYWEHGGEDAYFKNCEEYLEANHTFKASGEPVKQYPKRKPIIQKFILRGLLWCTFGWVLRRRCFLPMLKAFASDARFHLWKSSQYPWFYDFVKSILERFEGFFQTINLYTTWNSRSENSKKERKAFEVFTAGNWFPIACWTEKQKSEIKNSICK